MKNEKKTHWQLSIIRRILPYIARYRGTLILSMIFALISSLFMLYIPILIGESVDVVVGAGNVDYPSLTAILVKLALIAGGAALVQWLMNLCNNHMTYGIVKDLRSDAFEKIQKIPLSYLDTHAYGDIVSRMITDAEQVGDGLLLGFSQLFTGIVTIIGTLCFMLSIHPQIALLVICITPLSLLVAGFIASHTFSMFQKQSQTRGNQTSLVEEMIVNQKVVQAFRQEQQVLSEFDEINEQLKEFSFKAIFYSSLTNPCTRFVNGLVYAGVGAAGAIAAVAGGISVGQLASFLSYANQYTKPFNEISGVFTELQNAMACAGRILELIEENQETPDLECANVLSKVEGNVVMEEVSFSYVSNQPFLSNINVKAQKGQRIAIVGPTGCGKTTLINLMMRFYELDGGKIKIDEQDIAKVTRESLRESCGMVLQDTWLKHDTILNNIRIGDPDATEEEVIAAAKKAHAHSFIIQLRNGYHTVTGEDGAGLSQGQKQLLCIARLLLSPPPVLILDEATSSIDTRTEMKIQNAFTELMQGRTSFIVAHRLSTVENADRILVMENGRVIEQGSHSQLMAEGGFYAQLYQSQYENVS
ncbi:MAG: ABC transporter ATP-binding protein [Lachnospiraceae bacterium]